MRLFLGLLFFIPLAFAIGFFVDHNSAPVSVRLLPLTPTVTMWAALWVLIPLAVGVLFGMAVGWLSGTGWRRRARRAERRVAALEREIDAQEEAPRKVAPTGAALAPPVSDGRRAQIGG